MTCLGACCTVWKKGMRRKGSLSAKCWNSQGTQHKDCDDDDDETQSQSHIVLVVLLAQDICLCMSTHIRKSIKIYFI